MYLIISAIVSELVFSIPFFAFAELIKLFVRIEFNTRKDADSELNKSFDLTGHQQKFVDPDKNEISYEDWKKDNPAKTIIDYYASMRKD